MIEWISTNKDWIFSGIGVTAISGAAAWIIARRNRADSGSDAIDQDQRGGSNSTNIQIGKVERRDR